MVKTSAKKPMTDDAEMTLSGSAFWITGQPTAYNNI